MTEPSVYKLYLQPGMKMVLGLLLVAFVGGAAALITWSLTSQHPKAPPLAVGLIWFGIVIIYLFFFLSMPHRITLASDGTVEFISLWRRRTVRAEEIKSIRPEGSQFGFFMVRTERGKIRLLAQFDGFHDFLSRLQAMHPGVELRGC